jgi:RNA polymerase sigma-70 factor (ECF subfamily)
MEPESIAKKLWRRASAGDQSAYEQLFALHCERLMIFIRTRMGADLRSKVDPEDVLQASYLAAHRAFGSFEYSSDGAFFRWLCRIASNRTRDEADHFRADKRQPVELRYSWPTGPQTAVARAESHQRLETALNQLSSEHREVVLLRYFEGLTAEETGARMSRTPSAVRNLLSRALVELGKRIKQMEAELSHE